MTGCLIKLQFCSIQTPPLLQMYIGNTSYLPKDQFFRSFPMIVMVQQFLDRHPHGDLMIPQETKGR